MGTRAYSIYAFRLCQVAPSKVNSHLACSFLALRGSIPRYSGLLPTTSKLIQLATSLIGTISTGFSGLPNFSCVVDRTISPSWAFLEVTKGDKPCISNKRGMITSDARYSALTSGASCTIGGGGVLFFATSLLCCVLAILLLLH